MIKQVAISQVTYDLIAVTSQTFEDANLNALNVVFVLSADVYVCVCMAVCNFPSS